MVTFRVFPVLIIALLVASLTTPSVAQESTRADFEEFCDMLEGRWVGDVIWVADWPGFGKKGDRVTAYIENTRVSDGHALVGRYFGGQGTGTGIYTYDACTKQIRELTVSSGGTVWKNIFYKKDGKWMIDCRGSNPDGAEIKGEFTLNISDDGKTHKWRGWSTIGGEKAGELKDVWRRITE